MNFRDLPKTSLLSLFLSVAMLWPHSAISKEIELRLVCALGCSIDQLNSFQLRKLFLGITVSLQDGRNLIPIRNYSDESLKAIFHQTIIGMTEKSYERKLLQSRMNFAAKEPKIYKDEAVLLRELKEQDLSVSFAWSTSVTLTEETSKTIQVLWAGESYK